MRPEDFCSGCWSEHEHCASCCYCGLDASLHYAVVTSDPARIPSRVAAALELYVGWEGSR